MNETQLNRFSQNAEPAISPVVRTPSATRSAGRDVKGRASLAKRTPRRDVGLLTSSTGVIRGCGRAPAGAYDTTACAVWQMLPSEERGVEGVAMADALRGALKARIEATAAS